MKTQKQKIIKCPSCGAKYIPSEIFIPSYLMEKKEVEKDCCGNIVYCEGREPEYKERYKCDYCNQTFIVTATVDFEVQSPINFADEDVIKITPKLTMAENDSN